MRNENKNKIGVHPELDSGSPSYLFNKENNLINNNGEAGDPECPQGGPNFITATKAFTLIELLVVVLIIGILAAVAVPQYQKAVEKSKSAQAFTMLKSVYEAVNVYYLANGTWPTSFDDLGIQVPWTGNSKWVAGDSPAKSNGDWSVQLWSSDNKRLQGVSVGRIRGKYKGAGFAILLAHERPDIVPLKTLLCVERTDNTLFPFEEIAGAYCQQVMNFNTKISGHGATQFDLFKQN